jgi:hypothetical protein
MSLVWIEGFEGAGTGNSDLRDQIVRRYTTVTDPADIENIAGRNGRCLRYSNSSVALLLQNIPSHGSIIVGAAHRRSSWTADRVLITYREAGVGQHLRLLTATGGGLQVVRDVGGSAVVLATITGLGLDVDVWHYIEFKAVIDPTDGSFEVRFSCCTLAVKPPRRCSRQSQASAPLEPLFEKSKAKPVVSASNL